jgi:hypothetical protein
MATEGTASGLTGFRHLLEESASGGPAANGGLSLPTFSRGPILAAEPGGLPLISIALPKNGRCSGPGRGHARVVPGLRSAVGRALRKRNSETTL